MVKENVLDTKYIHISIECRLSLNISQNRRKAIKAYLL